MTIIGLYQSHHKLIFERRRLVLRFLLKLQQYRERSDFFSFSSFLLFFLHISDTLSFFFFFFQIHPIEIDLNEKVVLEQIETLRFAEISRTIRDDFPLQFPWETFFQRYKILLNISAPKEKKISRDTCWKLLQFLEKTTDMSHDSTWWRLGETLVRLSFTGFFYAAAIC